MTGPHPGRVVQGRLELGRRSRLVRDGAHTPAVALTEHVAQCVQTRGRLEVVARVPAPIEQGDEVIPGEGSSRGDCHPCPVEHLEGTACDRGRNPCPEQRGRQEPPVDLGFTSLDVDPQRRREPAATCHEAPNHVGAGWSCPACRDRGSHVHPVTVAHAAGVASAQGHWRAQDLEVPSRGGPVLLWTFGPGGDRSKRGRWEL